MLKPIYSIHPDALLEQIVQAGFKSFRFKQLIKWLYPRAVNNLNSMTDLPADLKQYLTDNFSFALPVVKQNLQSPDGSSKFVLELADGELIEAVLMPEGEKNTLCISSQVGCAWGCAFCATGKLGAIRDLTIDEIIAQIIIAKQMLKEDKLTNLVFMGMGEPLDNLDNVIPAIRILQSDYGLQFSPRRMTISTCGFVPKIYELSETGVRIKLAVSLNSAINSKRDQIMPVNKNYNLVELKKAILQFRYNSSWRITLEYIMIPGFNMGEEDAAALIKFVGDISCKLNLISYNKVEGFEWRSPTLKEAMAFQDKLKQLAISVTIRKSRGTAISAACGQLAAQSKVIVDNVAQDADPA